MIKLKDLLDEVVHVQMLGESGDEELMKQGFKWGTPTRDPETGASVTDVI